MGKNAFRYVSDHPLVSVPVALGVTTLLLVAGSPQVRFVYDNARLQVMMEAVIGLVALLAAFLLLGRYQRSGLWRDVLLVYALTLLGITHLVFSALPAAVVGDNGDRFSSWAPLVCRTIGTAALTAAIFARARVPERLSQRSAGAAVAGAALLTLTIVGGAIVALGDVLPQVVETARAVEAERPRLHGQPAVMVIQAVIVGLFAIAAVGFYHHGRRDSDELMGWFAAGTILAAFAGVNFLLYPSLYTDLFYTGEILRLGFYGCLLVGASREIASYWGSLALLAVAEERRRVAHDLHDGLAQELALVATHSRWLMRRPAGEQSLALLSEAAERALDESRRAIAALKRPVGEPLEVAVAQMAEEVAARVGAEVRLDLDAGPVVDAEVREALLRIVRDAVTDVSRRGGAQQITVELRRDDGIRLRIVAEAGNLSDRTEGSTRVGLESITERARAVGGEVRIDPSPDGGSEIEVVVS